MPLSDQIPRLQQLVRRLYNARDEVARHTAGVVRKAAILTSALAMVALLMCCNHLMKPPSSGAGRLPRIIIFNLYRHTSRHYRNSSVTSMRAHRLMLQADEEEEWEWEEEEEEGEEDSLTATFPTHGSFHDHGIYYVEFEVGHSPKMFYLDMDTGSHISWINCARPLFREPPQGPHGLLPMTSTEQDISTLNCNSPICNAIQGVACGPRKPCRAEDGYLCHYFVKYEDGDNSTGVVVNTPVSLRYIDGTRIQFKLPLGCGYDQQGSNYWDATESVFQHCDGLLGLSPSDVSLPAQLKRKNVIDKNVVGHCMPFHYTTEAGYLFMGEHIVPPEGMTWSNMIQFPTKNYFADLQLRDITYGEQTLWVANYPDQSSPEFFANILMLDSGSELSSFPDEAYRNLYLAVASDAQTHKYVKVKSGQEMRGTYYEDCWSLPLEATYRHFQSIELNILSDPKDEASSTSSFCLQPKQYLVITHHNLLCIGIEHTQKEHDSFYLGVLSLRGYMIVYDNENHQIGWQTRVHCEDQYTATTEQGEQRETTQA